MRSFPAALLLATTALVQPAVAADAKPASVAQLVKAVNIPYQQFTLKNGLRVIVHTDRKAPVVAVSVWYDVGSKHEPKGKTGFAHLFEHLMFNGSENVAGDFFEPLQQIGATDTNGTTWFDRTNYFETVPVAALDRVLFMEADRMGNLLGGITQTKLDNQRSVVQNEKRQGDNQPYGLVEYAQIEGLFPAGHPYGHSTIGSMKDLDAASIDDVKDWFRQHYGPNNAVLVLAGDIDLPTARKLVEKRFGAIPRGPQQQRFTVTIPTLPAPRSETMKDQVATTRIHRWWVAPGSEDNSESIPLSMGMTVLGGLSSSRLDNALVRDEKLAVNVSASLQTFAQMSIVEITADVRPGVDVAKVNKRLDELTASLIAEGPTADEVQRVATRSVSSRISGLEQVGGFGGKAVALAEGALYSGDPARYRKDMLMMAAATPASIRASLAKWLNRPAFQVTVEPGERAAYAEADKVAPPPAGDNEKLDVTKLPQLGAFPALDFPTIERGKLSNGMEVYFARRTAIPRVQMSVSFDVGYAADPKDALGTQSLMLSMMAEGTTTRSSRQIAEDSERLGLGWTSGGSLDRTNFNLSALSANLGLSLDFLADIIRNPAFAPAEVERVRAQQLARISGELKDPGGIAGRVMSGLLWGKEHPYAVPGSGAGDAKVVKTLTADQLRAFHNSWLRPDKARIFVVGNTSLAAITGLLEKSFGSWKAPATPAPVKNFNIAPPPARGRIVLVNRANSPQSIISAAVVLDRSGRDDLVTLRAANDVLGGDFLSRINTELRETKGWSYGSFSAIGNQEKAIAFSVRAPVQADRTGDSIRAIQAQFVDFYGQKGVSTDELTRTVNGSIRELPGSFETSGAVLGSLQRIINLDRPDDYFERLPEKYSAMTTAQLDSEFRKVIDPKSLVWLVVGDAKKIRPQLDGLGLSVEEMPAPGAE